MSGDTLAATDRKVGCFTPAVITRSATPQGRVLTAMTPSTYEEPDRKGRRHSRRQSTYGVRAARHELTMLAIVDKQCARPQGRARVCQQSTTRAKSQGSVHSVSTGSSEPNHGVVLWAPIRQSLFTVTQQSIAGVVFGRLAACLPHAHPVCRPQGRCDGSAVWHAGLRPRVETAVYVPAELNNYGAALRAVRLD